MNAQEQIEFDDMAQMLESCKDENAELRAEVERLQLDYAEAMRQYDEAQRRACTAEAKAARLQMAGELMAQAALEQVWTHQNELGRLREESQRRMDELITSLTQSVDFVGRLSEIPAVDA